MSTLQEYAVVEVEGVCGGKDRWPKKREGVRYPSWTEHILQLVYDGWGADYGQREARKVEKTKEAERGPHYATASVCVSCHRSQFARWTFTSHARAHDTLKTRGEADNPECLGCHTLGFGEEGGFGELTPFRLSQYGGVQCESCHGMLAGHPEDTTVRPEPVGPATCLRCHDPANSPEFDYDVYLRSVHCPIGGEASPP